MKTIGLLGGMSWESTIPYYRIVNETVRARLGGLHSAQIVLYSVDFHSIEILQRAGRWQEAGEALTRAGVALQRAGADCLVLCTNTMHKVAAQIEQATSIPLLHIADATGVAVRDANVRTVGLLGTKFTMEQDFYVERLRTKFDLEVLVPDAPEREEIHRVIYDELCVGRTLQSSRATYEDIIESLIARGAQGIILGCTEISLLVEPAQLKVPAFDTTRLHAEYAALWALQD
jgi:aspartate racemase